MLLLTLLIMGAGTAAIGLLPSYDAIGWWAPVLLVTLRVLQGIGVGGEYGGAVLLAVEYAPAERRGFFGSFAHIGVPGGLLLASGAFSLASLLPDEAFLAWGWRACFLASVVLLAIGAYIRLSVMETPAFARVQERKEVSTLPLRDLLAAQPRRLLLGMGTRFIEGFTFNFFSVFLLAYVVTNLGLPRSLALARRDGRRGARGGARADHRGAVRPGRSQAGVPGRRLAGAASSRSRSPRSCSPPTAWRCSRSSWSGSACSTARSTAPWPRSGPSCSTPATATRRSARSTRCPASWPPG